MSRPTGFAPEVRDGILLRDGERCAMQGHPACRGGRATEANHRLNRGMGGDSRAVVNSPANGAAVEHSCNWRLEVSAEFAEEGRRRGVKLDHERDDEAAIVARPMWSVLYGQWVVLTPAAMYLTGERDFHLDARELVVSGDAAAGFRVVLVNVPAIETTGVRA